MTKEELKNKYARVPTDFSEIEMLKDQLLDSGLLEAAQVSPEDAGKVLGVKEDGTIGVVEGGGSDNRIRIPSSIGNDSSLQDIIDLNIGITMPNPYSYKSYDVFFEGSFYYDNNKYYISNKPATLMINYYGSASIRIIFDDQWSVNKVVQHSAVATGENTVLSAYTDSLRKNLIGVPDAAATDAGKVVKVAGAGSYELGEVSGGTQLYKHSFMIDGENYELVNTSADVIDSSMQDSDLASYLLSSLKMKIGTNLIVQISFIGSGVACKYIKQETTGTPPDFETKLAFGSVELHANSITDTVTPL